MLINSPRVRYATTTSPSCHHPPPNSFLLLRLDAMLPFVLDAGVLGLRGHFFPGFLMTNPGCDATPALSLVASLDIVPGIRPKKKAPYSMATYQTPDSKKEEFRKYLEKSGVIDALTKGN